MKLLWKRLAPLLALVFCFGIVGCGKSDPQGDGKETYTLTVLLPDGSPAAGVSVGFTEADDADAETYIVETDGNGVASATLDAANYHIEIVGGIPDGYECTNTIGWYTVNGNDFSVTLTQAAAKVTYTINVTYDADGSPAEGIGVTYSATAGGAANTLGTTDSDGKLVLNIAPITGYLYLGWISGYTYSRNYGDDSPYLLSALGGVYSFTLYSYSSLSLTEPMTDDEKDKYADGFYSYSVGANGGADGTTGTVRTSYYYEVTLAAGETKVFRFLPDQSDTYYIYQKNAGITTKLYGSAFNLSAVESVQEIENTALSSICTAGTYCWLSVTNTKTTANTAYLVIAEPEEKNTLSITADSGSFEAQVKEGLPLTLSYRPESSGQYEISLTFESGVSYTIDHLSTAYTVIDSVTDESYTVNVLDTNLYYYDENGNIDYDSPSALVYLFRISVNGEVTYPVDFTITVTRIGDAIEKKSVVTYVEVSGTLSQYAEQSGTLTAIGMNGTNSQIVYSETDGYYHFGSGTGPVVVIKLKGTISGYYDEVDFLQLDFNGGSSPYRVNVTTDGDTDYQFLDYTCFLRGYKSPTSDSDNNAVAPDESDYDVDVYYAKYVNSDGVYPLTAELMQFLKYFVYWNNTENQLNGEGAWIVSCAEENNETYTQESIWLFSAYYYAQ